ncbi:MAG: prepilin-type N-terminal cleavage/methylation domain-containing protein [Tepidiformaceae bacterium]
MRSARGFTLVELLVVVVVIGVLASIAIPKFANNKEKSYLAQMKSDLRNLATAQEGFFYDSTTYTASLVALNNFTPSQAVSITIPEATGKGWSAETKHSSTAKKCYIYSGIAAPIGLATAEGKIACG